MCLAPRLMVDDFVAGLITGSSKHKNALRVLTALETTSVASLNPLKNGLMRSPLLFRLSRGYTWQNVLK